MDSVLLKRNSENLSTHSKYKYAIRNCKMKTTSTTPISVPTGQVSAVFLRAPKGKEPGKGRLHDLGTKTDILKRFLSHTLAKMVSHFNSNMAIKSKDLPPCLELKRTKGQHSRKMLKSLIIYIPVAKNSSF